MANNAGDLDCRPVYWSGMAFERPCPHWRSLVVISNRKHGSICRFPDCRGSRNEQGFMADPARVGSKFNRRDFYHLLYGDAFVSVRLGLGMAFQNFEN